MNPFAALYAWWNAIPAAIREPIRSAAVSGSWTVQTAFWVLLGAASSDGANDTPQHFLQYIGGHYWGVIVGILLPTAYRARQGFLAATSVVQSSAATSIPNPVPPAEIVAAVVDPHSNSAPTETVVVPKGP